MRIRNLTDIDIYQTLWDIVAHARMNTKDLQVRLVWIRGGSFRGYSGHYSTKDNQIVVRIRKDLTYPYPLQIATGEWFENTDGSFFQIYRKVLAKNAKQILAFVFAHELSHYNDHKLGYNLRYKQTKSDKFSYKICTELRLLEPSN